MKRLIIAAVALLSIGAANGQNYKEDPRYGATPEEREENAKLLSYLKFEMDGKGYDVAAGYIKTLMNSAPSATANIYIYGATVYKNKAAKAKSVEEKRAIVDSVMLIYDRRAQYFGDNPTRGRAYILGQKAREYAALNPMDRDGVKTYYIDALEAGGDKVDPALVLEYFQQLVEDYRSSAVTGEALIGEYNRLTPVLASATDEQKDSFNRLFVTSGAAKSDVLEAMYKERLAKNPNDPKLIAEAYEIMSAAGADTPFYFELAEKHYANDPSPAVALRLASMFERQERYEDALKYLNAMVSSETDPKRKEEFYLRIAASELGLRRGSAAANAARQVIATDPGNGYALMMLAEAYVVGAAACGGFHGQTVYWLAYDQFARARQAFEAAGNEEFVRRVENRMGSCRASFPSFEDGFMYVEGYAEGKSYTVHCGWISGTTTIKSR